MIEVTDEMVGVAMETKAFELGRGASEFHATRRALAAVLAIVERDREPGPQRVAVHVHRLDDGNREIYSIRTDGERMLTTDGSHWLAVTL